MSLLTQQAAAIRKEHTIPERLRAAKVPAPSLLFSPDEAKKHDQDAFGALALHGLAEVSALEPELAAFAQLFEGVPRDRGTLTKEENSRLDGDIHRMLLLLSPHLQTRAAQECMDGLLARHAVHRWNVDDVLACVLPYHDSPLFTRLLQGLHIEGKPRWSWLQTLKAKPATLVRAALAKYCSKDLALLGFVGDVVQETVKMQKSNRALATFFATVWLDTLSCAKSVGDDLVNACLPTVQVLLRSPHLGDMFHAALVALGALCIKVDLGDAAQTQLLERIVKQVSGEHGRSAAASLVLMLQSQRSVAVSGKALRTVSNMKPKALTRVLPVTMDCSNLAAALLQSCLVYAATHADDEENQRLQAVASVLLQDGMYATCEAETLANAVLQAFCACIKGRPASDAGLPQILDTFRKPVAELSTAQPAALGAAFRKATDAAVVSGLGVEALVQLVTPVDAPLQDESSASAYVPLVQAFAHSSAKTRAAAVQTAVTQLQATSDEEADNPRNRLLASLVLQAVQDESPEVVEQALSLEALWCTLPQVKPPAAFSVLDSALAKMFGGARAKGASPQEVASAVLLGEPQFCRLAPALLRCFAWVYGRKGCTKALRETIDATLLPVLVLCLVALDASVGGGLLKASAAEAKKLAKLQSSVLAFCRASGHKFLSHFGAGTSAELGPFMKSLGSGSDEPGVVGLCRVVEAGVWLEAPQGGQATAVVSRAEALGGAATQRAAALLLAGFLPQIVESAGVVDAQRMVARCADACQRLAWHLALAKVSDSASEHLRDLLMSVFKATATVERRRLGGGDGEEKKRRRKSKSGATGGQHGNPLLGAVGGILHVVLERPRSLASVLRHAMGLPIGLLRPALLGLALGPSSATARHSDQLWSSAVANALLTLRSLCSQEDAQDWVLDQSVLAPLLARLASAKSREVREAAMQVLEALASAEAPGWDSPCAAALVEAGVLCDMEDVLPSKAWAAAQDIELSGMSKKVLGNFIKHFASCKFEILQDCSAVPPALSKFFASQASGKKAASGCTAFWAVGLSMLRPAISTEVPELLAAVPAADLATELATPLKAAGEETLEQLKAGTAEAKASALLSLAATAVAGLADSVEAASSFVRSVALPFCVGLADLHEADKGLRVVNGVAELAGQVCRSVSSTVAKPGASGLRQEAITALFRLGVAASTPHEGAEEEEEAQREGVATVATVTSAALIEAKLDAAILQKVLADSPAFKAKQLGTSVGCAAADLFCQQVVGLPAVGDDASDLLVALGKVAQTAAAKCEPDASAASSDTSLYHLLQAMAALSEQIGRSDAWQQATKAQAPRVQTVCDTTAELCTASGAKLTSAMLAAVVRTCGALAPLTPMPGKLGPLKKAAAALGQESPPLQACVAGLRSFTRPVGPDVLSALKANLRRLWRHPDVPDDAASVPTQLVGWDLQAQARLRLLLHTAVAGFKVPHESVGAAFCLSFARTAGIEASLDFAMMLFLAQSCGASTGNTKKPKQKRKSNAKKEPELELLPAQETATADEALGMLTSATGNTRYHCLGKLMLTLSAHAFQLRQAQSGEKGAPLSWRLALLPEAFQEGMSAEQALAVLDMGFVVAGRFISEFGLPSDLDQGEIDTASYTTVAGSSDDEDASPGLALCYAVWAACAADVFLDGLKDVDTKRVETCRSHCRQVRALLLRSLAVNHPLTFFHAVCLVLRVPEHCPTFMAGDHLADAEFLSGAAACMMQEAADALKKRLEYRAGKDAEAGDDETPELCGDLCTAVMRHVSAHFLSGEGSSLSEASRLTCWHFLDSLCQFCGRAVPKPVLQFCLPLSARCLAARAGGEGKYSVQEAIISCQCLQTAVQQLGRGLLEKLNEIVPPLFELVSVEAAEGDMEDDGSDAVLLEQRALQTLHALVKSVGPFLSPFLPRYLRAVSAASPAWKTPQLEELGRSLIAQVPRRILWPALQAAVKAAMGGLEEGALSAVLHMQRLAALHVWIFSGVEPEAVAEDAEGMVAALLGLLSTGTRALGGFLKADGEPQEVPIKLLCKGTRGEAVWTGSDQPWVEGCSGGSVASLHEMTAAAFAQFALRLDLEEVRQHFGKVLEWARHKQLTALAKQCTGKADEADAFKDGESASRMLAFFAVSRGLEREAPGIGLQLLLPLTIADMASCLTASRHCALKLGARLRPAARKKRKASGGVAVRSDIAVLHENTWWWFEVSMATLSFAGEALKSARTSTQASKPTEEAVDALTEPCADQLDIFKFLPAEKDSSITRQLSEALCGAAVSLAAASDSSRVKKVLTSILAKSRSDDVEIRLAAVRCCHRVWSELGVQVVSGLSEVVMYASELLEDEDSSVEEAVRAMIKTIEDCTGESLQDALKH